MHVRRLFSVLIPLALLVSTVRAADPAKYGAGVSLSETTPIRSVLETPADFEGRTVQIEGVVTAVCTMMGCWMALAPADQPDGKTLLIQVDHDGVIVFPVSAKGHRAAAQGVVERVGGSEHALEAASELAAQSGNQQSVPAQWRINATGALVY